MLVPPVSAMALLPSSSVEPALADSVRDQLKTKHTSKLEAQLGYLQKQDFSLNTEQSAIVSLK
jgi:hypothetical protein